MLPHQSTSTPMHPSMQSKMAENAEVSDDFIQANFSLLTDTDELFAGQLDENLSTEDVQQVENIILAACDTPNSENSKQDADFIGPLLPARHANLSEDKVDEFALKSNAGNTHYQTKWAVNVFRGKFHTLYSNN